MVSEGVLEGGSDDLTWREMDRWDRCGGKQIATCQNCSDRLGIETNCGRHGISQKVSKFCFIGRPQLEACSGLSHLICMCSSLFFFLLCSSPFFFLNSFSAPIVNSTCPVLQQVPKLCCLVGCTAMELDTLREAFDRVVEKRALSSTKVQEAIDQILNEVKQAISKMQMMSTDSTGSSDHPSILSELKTKLNEMVPLNQLEGCQKELNVALSKYLKLIEKSFNPDISKAYRNVDFEAQTVNNIIANHFYRQGLFDLGDSFVQECGESDGTYLKSPFQEMYGILEAMQARNLEPALSWAEKNHDKLLQNGSVLELKLHQLQFVEILTKESRDEALKYARIHLVPFASLHKAEIQKLMACLLWADRLDQSPYAEFMSSTHWGNLAEELTHQFCSILGQSSDSPLSVAISAGFQGLPTLLKLTTVMAAKKQEWQVMKQLPVPIDIGPEFQYHSVFVCPVLREQSSDENPPMLMPCGHAVSKQSLMKLSKSSSRPFKCPYCPSEAVASQCKQLHF